MMKTEIHNRRVHSVGSNIENSIRFALFVGYIRHSIIHTLYNCILILYRHSPKNLLFLVLCTI